MKENEDVMNNGPTLVDTESVTVKRERRRRMLTDDEACRRLVHDLICRKTYPKVNAQLRKGTEGQVLPSSGIVTIERPEWFFDVDPMIVPAFTMIVDSAIECGGTPRILVQRISKGMRELLSSISNSEVPLPIELKEFFQILNIRSLILGGGTSQFLSVYLNTLARGKSVSMHPVAVRDKTGKPRYFLLSSVRTKLFPGLQSGWVEITEQVVSKMRTSVASIMARNLSHNIGSHVLASPDLLSYVDNWEIQKLHDYLQQRLDFIAQVVTYTPSWSEPELFTSDILEKFTNQYLLLGHLLKDQGYSDDDISIFYSYGDNVPVEYKVFTSEGSSGRRGKWTANRETEDVMVAIPGGAVGNHALYDIMENILRNAAKYGDGYKNIDLHLHLSEVGGDRMKLTIWDNNSRQTTRKDRVGTIRKALYEELLQPNLDVAEIKCRGMHEMKECARVLGNPQNEQPGWAIHVRPETEEPLHLWADVHTDTEKSYLAYNLYLQKPRLVTVVDLAGTLQTATNSLGDKLLRSKGVIITNDLEGVIKEPSGLLFVILPQDDASAKRELLDFVGRNHRLLPYRILVSGTEAAKLELSSRNIPQRRIQWCGRHQFSILTTADIETFIIGAFESWLGAFKPLGRTGSKWQLVLSFDRHDTGHSAFERWQSGLTKFRSDHIDIHVVKAASDNELFDGLPQIIASTDASAISDERYLANLLETQPEKVILYDNHGILAALLSVGQGELETPQMNVACYHEFGAKYPKVFSYLSNPPMTPLTFSLFVISLVEASLMRVLIIDERITEAAHLRGKRQSDMFDAGAFVVTHIETKANERLALSRKLSGAQRTDKQPNREGLRLGEATLWAQRVNQNPSEKIEKGVDCIVLHQGIIEMLERRSQWDRKVDMPRLFDIAPSVVVTSGRGKTLEYSTGDGGTSIMPFIEFSIIRENTLVALSKYHLCRVLMSVVGVAASVT